MLIKEGKTNIKYLLIVIILAAVVGGGTLWCMTKQEAPLAEFPEVKIPKDETADWKTYRNEEYGFELGYPNEGKMNYEEKEEGYFRVHFSLPTVSYSWENEEERYELQKYFQITVKDSSIPMEEWWCGMYNIKERGTVHTDDVEFHKTTAEDGGMSAWSLLLCYSTIKKDKRFELVNRLQYTKHRVVPGRDFDQEKEDEVFNRILATFRFLD